MQQELDQMPVADSPASPQVVAGKDALFVDLGSFGVRFLARGADTHGRLSIVEHPVPPRTLAAPLHRHGREDEYSYVLQGRMGARLGDQTVEAGPGSLVFKPRGQWHTFWNAGDEPCRVLEIIAPAGFEEMFLIMAADPEGMMDERARALDAQFFLDVDYASINVLCREYNLRFPF